MRESLVLAMCTGAVHLPSRCHAGICHLWRHTDHCSRPPLDDKEVRQSGRFHGTHRLPVPVQCKGGGGGGGRERGRAREGGRGERERRQGRRGGRGGGGIGRRGKERKRERGADGGTTSHAKSGANDSEAW